ncbi:unnamed protein product [Sphenostylis stenocarpa]|uniref:Uncharacterized protein n=1 Tax=Sphenostylis stenocarpa TaxID=92480 RepID=A0AA86S7J3_9FABA|nr:unnamed protein product [Sphenostylis stenocarpa]
MEERGWRFCLQENYDTGVDKNEEKENPTDHGIEKCKPTERYIQNQFSLPSHSLKSTPKFK